MKKAGTIALATYLALVFIVIYDSWTKSAGIQTIPEDALGLIGFVFMALYIIIAGIAVPAIYLNKRYKQIGYTHNQYSPVTWIIGLSLLLLSVPIPLLSRTSITPKWISYPTMMLLCSIAAFGFMAFSILAILQLCKLL